MLKKRRRTEVLWRIDVTGFVSFMVVLICFMVMPPMHPHGVSIYLVSAPHSVSVPRANREDAMIVGIMRDGKVYFDTQLMYETDFAYRLKDRVGNGAEKKVYIKVDRHAHYRSVNYVLNQVRLAGIEKVAFLTELPYPDSRVSP